MLFIQNNFPKSPLCTIHYSVLGIKKNGHRSQEACHASTVFLLVFGADLFCVWDYPVHCRMFSSISGLYSLDARSTHIPSPSHDCRRTDSSLVESTWSAGRAPHGSAIGSQCRLAFFGRAVHCLQGAPFQAASRRPCGGLLVILLLQPYLKDIQLFLLSGL